MFYPLATVWTVRGSNPGGVECLRPHPDQPWYPPSLLYNGYRVSFPEGKAARGVVLTNNPHSSAEVKERVELCLYTPWVTFTCTDHLIQPLANMRYPALHSICSFVQSFVRGFTQYLDCSHRSSPGTTQDLLQSHFES